MVNRRASQPAYPGLVEKLMAAVRPEFRGAVLVFDPRDPVFGAPPCRVDGCDRPGRVYRMCERHTKRWHGAGGPPLEKYVATTDPDRWGYRPLAPCRVPGCRYGRAGNGLCPRHYDRWKTAGAPDADRWILGARTVHPPGPVTICLIARCDLWAHSGGALCYQHRTRWVRRGRPDLAVFAEACDEVPVPSGERLDLRPLGPHLRLEIQYAVQRRHDEQKIKIEPRLFQRIARFLAEVQVTSLLDWSEAAWRRRMSASWIGVHPRSLLIEARRQIEILTVGTGWDVEYPRDHWRLRTLGINDGSTANLRFGQISQPWLKNLAKQWARWRLTSGLSSAAVYRDVRAITRFSDFLTDPAVGVGDISQITRPLLERYLADLHADYGGGSTHSDHISGLSGFLTGIRRHGWNNSLPATAVFFPEDYPKPAQRLPRALAEHVMAQVENPDNLDRFDNPAFRLITIVLIQCGLRVKDAVRLPYDCLTEDHDGAPYLRYFNHKMKREALVPIDTALRQHIREQQQRLRKQRPEGVPVLFPRRNANLDATRPVSPTTYRVALREWLQRCDVRDENGNPVHLTPHQWRHTLGTRLINRDVPQEVVRKILDHDSAEMTAHYARLSDTTIRRHWEQARKVNIRGETVTFSPDGPLSDAAWAKHRLGHATQTLPNGYCGLPLVKTCQHANACLTCPMFITTVEFLPHHEAHHQQTLQLIAAAEARDQKRLAEMNRTVATNLEKIISSLRDDGTNRPETAADAS